MTMESSSMPASAANTTGTAVFEIVSDVVFVPDDRRDGC